MNWKKWKIIKESDCEEPFSSPCFPVAKFFSLRRHLICMDSGYSFDRMKFTMFFVLTCSPSIKASSRAPRYANLYLNLKNRSDILHCSSQRCFFPFPRSSCFANEFAISLISERAHWTLSFRCLSSYALGCALNLIIMPRHIREIKKINVFIFVLTENKFYSLVSSCAREPKAAKCSKF